MTGEGPGDRPAPTAADRRVDESDARSLESGRDPPFHGRTGGREIDEDARQTAATGAVLAERDVEQAWGVFTQAKTISARDPTSIGDVAASAPSRAASPTASRSRS